MAKSIWAALVVLLGSAILIPALNTGTPAANANRSAAANVSVAVGEPLANSLLGLLALIAAALFMAALVGGGEF